MELQEASNKENSKVKAGTSSKDEKQRKNEAIMRLDNKLSSVISELSSLPKEAARYQELDAVYQALISEKQSLLR